MELNIGPFSGIIRYMCEASRFIWTELLTRVAAINRCCLWLPASIFDMGWHHRLLPTLSELLPFRLPPSHAA